VALWGVIALGAMRPAWTEGSDFFQDAGVMVASGPS
jgi:hypothetical protein